MIYFADVQLDGYNLPRPGRWDVGSNYHDKGYNAPGGRAGYCAGNAEMIRPVDDQDLLHYGMFARSRLRRSWPAPHDAAVKNRPRFTSGAMMCSATVGAAGLAIERKGHDARLGRRALGKPDGRSTRGCPRADGWRFPAWTGGRAICGWHWWRTSLGKPSARLAAGCKAVSVKGRAASLHTSVLWSFSTSAISPDAGWSSGPNVVEYDTV